MNAIQGAMEANSSKEIVQGVVDAIEDTMMEANATMDTIQSTVDTLHSSMDELQSTVDAIHGTMETLQSSNEANSANEIIKGVVDAIQGTMEARVDSSQVASKRSKCAKKYRERVPKNIRADIGRTRREMIMMIRKAFPDAKFPDINKYIKRSVARSIGIAMKKCLSLTEERINETIYDAPSNAQGKLT
jgi:outer membrane murein-binding lipoprotein Lpp